MLNFFLRWESIDLNSDLFFSFFHWSLWFFNFSLLNNLFYFFCIFKIKIEIKTKTVMNLIIKNIEENRLLKEAFEQIIKNFHLQSVIFGLIKLSFRDIDFVFSDIPSLWNVIELPFVILRSSNTWDSNNIPILFSFNPGFLEIYKEASSRDCNSQTSN